MNRILDGMLSGIAATVPMTAAMQVMQGMLPGGQRRPAPPRRIAMNLARHAHLSQTQRNPDEEALSLPAHFAFGAAAGAIYSVLQPRVVGSGPMAGAVYATGVWAASYNVLMPALGLHRPAFREPAGRNAMMIAAHWVFGAALGALVRPKRTRLRKPRQSSSPPERPRAFIVTDGPDGGSAWMQDA